MQAAQFEFQSKRLFVESLNHTIASEALLASITNILTPEVTQNLPPNFQDINNPQKASDWFNSMKKESFFYSINTANDLIGFLFLYADDEVRIGYLIDKPFWRQGFAQELLAGLIETCKHLPIGKLIAGVTPENTSSIYLLKKVGFNQQDTVNSNSLEFVYDVSPNHS